MTRGERRKKLYCKFKKRLKYWANIGYPVKDRTHKYATSWDQLLDYYNFRDQFSSHKESKSKVYNLRGLKKKAYKRILEELDEVNHVDIEFDYDYDPYLHYNKIHINSRY